MFVWRRRAGAAWLAANEAALREIAGLRLAIISKPQHRSAIAEIAGQNRDDLKRIRSRFGGAIEKLPRDWLQEFTRAGKTEPIKIGKRLVIHGSSADKNWDKRKSLRIPASIAFGTGEHATTAMSLRMLERLTRCWGEQAANLRSPNAEWSLLDLGTGSGILALAAARFGAKRIAAIDNDPVAIATAKENANRNKIKNIDFHLADVRRWKVSLRTDIITANLLSELLIEILPKLKAARWLILSGILRKQGPQLRRALRRNGFALAEMRGRGKWIAILARGNRGTARSWSPK